MEISWKAMGRGGAVAAGGSRSVEAGLGLLEDGGNAADAAVATLLALAVTDYGRTCIGGEIPLMFYHGETGKVEVLSGVGRAPLDTKAIEWYLANGIPSEGGPAAIPVPGFVDLCVTALRRYGTVGFEAAVGPTLDLLAGESEPWHGPLRRTLLKLVEAERAKGGSREEALGAVSERFYRGDVAEELVAFYERSGSWIRMEDMAAHSTPLEEPARIAFRGYEVYKCGPWTQGPCLLQALQLLDGYDLAGMGFNSSRYAHVVIEALKLALADRDAYYADPRFREVPLERLLSKEYAELRRGLIEEEEASMDFRPGDPVGMHALAGEGSSEDWGPGTTTCVTVDCWGNLVSATPSANPPYHVCEELGIAHGNRLRCLNTNLRHPNVVEPGKRPRITLTPTIAVKPGEAVIGISVAGGDLQDQTALQCLLNHLVFGMGPAEAVTGQRFCTEHHEDSFTSYPDRRDSIVGRGRLGLDGELFGECGEALRKLGHEVYERATAVADPVMVRLDLQTGQVEAAGDPRSGRHAGVLNPKSQ